MNLSPCESEITAAAGLAIALPSNQMTEIAMGKHELDDSYKVDSNAESGICLSNISQEDEIWHEFIKGEVCDIQVFDPPINSTAVNDNRISCSLSTIEHEGSSLFGPGVQSGSGLFGGDGITNSTQRDFAKEVSDGNSVTTPGQVRNGLWWLNAANHEVDIKAEFSHSHEQEELQHKSEALFKTDASNFMKDNVSSLALNTDFSFAALVKEETEAGNDVQGYVEDIGAYRDYCTIRVRDVSKIKSDGMVMVRTKFEAAWIKPGLHLDQSGASNKDGPHYVKLLNVILAEKIKVIKQLMLKLAVIGDMVRATPSGCLIRELGSLDCRKGCIHCHLSEKMEVLTELFQNKEDGPVCEFQSARMVTEILETDDAAEWIVSNCRFQQILEFHLWNHLRVAVANHVSGAAVHSTRDLDIMLSLAHNALGEHYYSDLSTSFKAPKEDASNFVFNSEVAEGGPSTGSHLVILELHTVTGVSTGGFSAQLRKWNGKADIAIGKNKKKFFFSGLDIGETTHSVKVVCKGVFTGIEFLPDKRPAMSDKLHPISCGNRTILG